MYKGYFTQTNRVALSDEVTDSTSRGSSTTVYSNQPVKYGGEMAEPAMKEMVFLSSVFEDKLEEGHGQYLARYRAIYDDADGVTLNTGEAITSSMSNYAGNFKAGIWIVPTPRHKKMDIGWVADHKNMDDIPADSMEQLSYIFADTVDQYIASALASATEMTNSVRGARLIYAGGKTSDDALTTADTMTTSLVNEAETALSKKEAYYWNSTTLTRSALNKNPWKNTADDPFVLVIGKDQIKAFRESSLFLNANEYGGNQVRLSGEIGQTIFGTRVVVSDNIPTKTSSTEAWDGTTNTTVDIARCFLMKGSAAYVFVWGREPEFRTVELEDKLGTQLKLWGMYAGSVLHADAIVKIDVATNIPVY